MHSKEFLGRLDHKRISDAIAAAEKTSSGEIRVYIQRGEITDDPLAAAQKKFAEAGMHKTSQRNAVLIWVAPRAQRFAIVGDEGVHQKCGAEFWQKLASEMHAHFSKENFTEGLTNGIGSVGALLARFFPRGSSDRNELPDTIIED